MAYIDREKAIAYVEEQYRLFDNNESKQAVVEGCVEALKFTPTADVVEVKHGEWISLSEPRLVDDIKQIRVECSNCKIQRYIPAIEQHGYYYCPNCGVRMDGDLNDL